MTLWWVTVEGRNFTTTAATPEAALRAVLRDLETEDRDAMRKAARRPGGADLNVQRLDPARGGNAAAPTGPSITEQAEDFGRVLD